jgi:ketosteroid isomerase-like protein
MKSLLPCLAFTLLLGACGRPPPADAVLGAEQARVAALIADDHAALDRLLSDDLTYTHSNSIVDTKAAFMESLTSGQLKYRSLEHSDQEVRIYGDTAILTGLTRVHSLALGEDIRLTLRFTIVYVRKDGRWQMAAWQSTRVPG